jgi:hypothetical protein
VQQEPKGHGNISVVLFTLGYEAMAVEECDFTGRPSFGFKVAAVVLHNCGMVSCLPWSSGSTTSGGFCTDVTGTLVQR